LAKIVAQRETEDKSFGVVANGFHSEPLDNGVGASLPVFQLTTGGLGKGLAGLYSGQSATIDWCGEACVAA
jgi:hypothetical protein